MKNFMRISLVVFTFCFVVSGFYPMRASIQEDTSQSTKQTPLTKTKLNSPGQSENEGKSKQTTQPATSPKSTKNPPLQQTNPNDDRKSNDSPATDKTAEQANTTPTKPSPTPSSTPASKGWLDDLWTILTWLALVFLGLISVGLVGWFVYYVLTNISREKDTNIKGFQNVRESQKQLVVDISNLNKLVKLQNDRIERQDKLIQQLQNQLKTENVRSYSAQSQQIIEQQPVYKPEPQFPVSVENYLNKVRHQGQKATADFIGGLLIQDPNKGEEFLIVKDSALASGLFYAVPSIDRFSKGTDFTTYYQNYYDCENPSGGAVRILSPTIVSRVDGGWKLEEKGKLEVRN